jgi:hypothetical protein
MLMHCIQPLMTPTHLQRAPQDGRPVLRQCMVALLHQLLQDRRSIKALLQLLQSGTALTLCSLTEGGKGPTHDCALHKVAVKS